MTSYEICIVGGGPVGQLAGILLGQRGHRVGIFERWPDPYPLPRACGLSHEPVRVLQSAGLGEQFTEVSDAVIGAQGTYHFTNAKGETLRELVWTDLGDSGWPEMSTFYQPDVERIFAEALDRLPNVELFRGVECTKIEQGPDRVVLTLNGVELGPDPTVVTLKAEDVRTVEASYVIGADGANSIVRDVIGAEIEDLGFAFDWLVVDTIPREARVWDPYLEQRCDPARPTTAVPSGPGRRRWEFMRLPGESMEELNTPETAWRLLEPWDITPENAQLVRHAVYTFRGRWADRWRDGRLILAGDAAHLMPPFLGQGLGSGIRDVIAMAWRLDLVLRGVASDTLLDSYTPERLGHVRQVIGQSVEAGRAICILDPEGAAERDRAMLAARNNPQYVAAPPPWRLGPGLWREDDDNAGIPFVQGTIVSEGRRGKFDDVVGGGFLLLGRNTDPENSLGPEAREVWNRVGGRGLHVAPGGPVDDVDGVYTRWFDQRNVDLVLVRPDFIVLGTANADDGADDLVRWLGAALPPAGKTTVPPQDLEAAVPGGRVRS
ncbi:bifunctional 3-(3-hydroxy-phenyl)propionate/3-hydroxycinnamic acid hydroxylase MhpA [Streptomyces acidicola]|uniref:bifunctional 3-(3-hydroxy-phenyl)propionate/3-hydroxycinnamic acid hydroxylase MhpA n=1 Tax=Streptomyces acidicola TaxID=2596892 RepID=UPI0038023658